MIATNNSTISVAILKLHQYKMSQADHLFP